MCVFNILMISFYLIHLTVKKNITLMSEDLKNLTCFENFYIIIDAFVLSHPKYLIKRPKDASLNLSSSAKFPLTT